MKLNELPEWFLNVKESLRVVQYWSGTPVGLVEMLAQPFVLCELEPDYHTSWTGAKDSIPQLTWYDTKEKIIKEYFNDDLGNLYRLSDIMWIYDNKAKAFVNKNKLIFKGKNKS